MRASPSGQWHLP